MPRPPRGASGHLTERCFIWGRDRIPHGVDARFPPPVERLAFALFLSGETDLPEIWPDPLSCVLEALGRHAAWDDLLADLPDVPHAPLGGPSGVDEFLPDAEKSATVVEKKRLPMPCGGVKKFVRLAQ